MLLNKGGEKPWHAKEKVKEKVVGKVNRRQSNVGI